MDHSSHSRRQIAGLIAACLGAPAAAHASPRSAQLGAMDQRSIVAAVKPSALTPGSTIETSDDPFRRMTAPVTINDKGPFFFVVDTGANQSVISTELAAEIGLPAGQDVSLHGVAGMEVTHTAIADRVQVGSRVEKAVMMPVLPQSAIGAPGILGIDRLRNQRLRLDFRARKLTVETSRFAQARPYTTRVPARHRSGQLTIVDADLAGIKVAAFLDSGAERTIGNPALHQLSVLKAQNGAFFDVPIVSVTGRTIPGQIALLPVLRLGHVRLLNISVTFADLHVFQIWGLEQPAILLGMDALSTFDSVTLDFGRAEVLFELYPRRGRSQSVF